MAKSRNVGMYLTMKDRYTKTLDHFSSKIKNTEADVAKMALKMQRTSKKAKVAIADMAKKSTIALATISAGLAGAGIKQGFSEAFNMEGYKAQLETATKDTKKAGQIMRDAIQLANKTPFEGGELVEAAAKFESMGMSAKKWLSLTGDMAGATNKSFDQATEALIDAQTGELERLKEFGITKAMISKKAGEMFANQEVVNNKGQIVNQEKFNEALVALMQEKYKGGMEKLSQTTKGLWSTITGVTKSSLAKFMGMQEDGTVRTGSAMDMLKQRIEKITKLFEKWQSDGTMDKIAAKVDVYAKKFFDFLDTVPGKIKWIKDNANWIIPMLKTVGGLMVGAFAVKKVAGFITALGQIKTGFQAIKLLSNKNLAGKLEKSGNLFKGLKNSKIGKGLGKKLFGNIAKESTSATGKTLLQIAKLGKGAGKIAKFGRLFRGITTIFRMGSPIGWLTIAIEGGITLYKNWDKVKDAAGKLKDKVKSLKDKFINFVPEPIKKFAGIVWGIVSPFKKMEIIISAIKSLLEKIHAPEWLIKLIDKGKDILNGLDIFSDDSQAVTTVNAKGHGGSSGSIDPKPSGALGAFGSISRNALGTSYFRGGATFINEGGRDEVAIFPSGMQIIPNSIAKKGKNDKGIIFNIIVQGNVIGEESYIRKLGKYIADEINMAILTA